MYFRNKQEEYAKGYLSSAARAPGEADLTLRLKAFLENMAIGLDPLGRDWSTPALCLKGNSGSQERRPDTNLVL